VYWIINNSIINKDMETQEETVEYWRHPTQYEIKFGEGAIHWLTVKESDVRKKNGKLKKWFINPYDGLRYNY
jgi:hypothetical protein